MVPLRPPAHLVPMIYPVMEALPIGEGFHLWKNNGQPWDVPWKRRWHNDSIHYCQHPPSLDVKSSEKYPPKYPSLLSKMLPNFNWTHHCWSKKGESFGRSKTVNAWCLFYPANFPEDLLQIWWNPAHCRMIHHLFTLALPTSITTGHKATGLKPHPLGTELPLPLASANKPPRRVIPASCFFSWGDAAAA